MGRMLFLLPNQQCQVQWRQPALQFNSVDLWYVEQVFCGHQELTNDGDDDDIERREYGVNLLPGSENRTSHEQQDSPSADGGMSPPWLHDSARLAAHVSKSFYTGCVR